MKLIENVPDMVYGARQKKLEPLKKSDRILVAQLLDAAQAHLANDEPDRADLQIKRALRILESD